MEWMRSFHFREGRVMPFCGGLCANQGPEYTPLCFRCIREYRASTEVLIEAIDDSS